MNQFQQSNQFFLYLLCIWQWNLIWKLEFSFDWLHQNVPLCLTRTPAHWYVTPFISHESTFLFGTKRFPFGWEIKVKLHYLHIIECLVVALPLGKIGPLAPFTVKLYGLEWKLSKLAKLSEQMLSLFRSNEELLVWPTFLLGLGGGGGGSFLQLEAKLLLMTIGKAWGIGLKLTIEIMRKYFKIFKTWQYPLIIT